MDLNIYLTSMKLTGGKEKFNKSSNNIIIFVYNMQGIPLIFYVLYTFYQLISRILLFFKKSLALENGLLPLKPYVYENGDG